MQLRPGPAELKWCMSESHFIHLATFYSWGVEGEAPWTSAEGDPLKSLEEGVPWGQSFWVVASLQEWGSWGAGGPLGQGRKVQAERAPTIRFRAHRMSVQA